jgi:hypothetical protein
MWEPRRLATLSASTACYRDKFILPFLPFYLYLLYFRSRYNSVGIATGYELEGRGSILDRGKIFFLFHSVQTGSGSPPASYPMGTGGSFRGDKAAEA